MHRCNKYGGHTSKLVLETIPNKQIHPQLKFNYPQKRPTLPFAPFVFASQLTQTFNLHNAIIHGQLLKALLLGLANPHTPNVAPCAKQK